jgi:hypothetical protein
LDKNGNVPTQAEFGNADQAGRQVQQAFITRENIFDGENVRYVGLSGGGIVDLRHFATSFAYTRDLTSLTGSFGLASGTVLTLGTYLEMRQWSFRMLGKLPLVPSMDKTRSAFSPEDIPSNRLGAEFAKIYDPTKPLAPQVTAFLKKLGSMTSEEFAKKYPELWKSLPTVNQDAKMTVDYLRSVNFARKALNRHYRERGRANLYGND